MSNDTAVLLGMVMGAAFTWVGIWAGRRIEWRLHRTFCACPQCIRFQEEDIERRFARLIQKEK